MKKTSFRRTLSLVLAALLMLSAAELPVGGARAAEDPPTPPAAVEKIVVEPQQLTIDPGKNGTIGIRAYTKPENSPLQEILDIKPQWSIQHAEVASLTPSQNDPRQATVTGLEPGKTQVQISAGGLTEICELTVSGLRLEKTELTVFTGRTESVGCEAFGDAAKLDKVWSSDNISVAEVMNGKIVAHYPGKATITVTAGRYTAKCTVIVKEDLADAIPGALDDRRLCGMASFLPKLQEYSQTRAKGPLEFITNLTVPANQGVLYRGYVSPEDQGHGVGGGETYYVTPGPGQSGFSDVTFVPTPGFSGTAVITYTGQSTAGIPFHGTIRIEIKPQNDVTYHTSQGRPVSFAVEDFQAICRARTGRSARYLSFEPPASDKGGLFRHYEISGEYAQRVTRDMKLSTANTNEELLSFVPTKDFVGTVVVPYTCEDASGSTYTGHVTIIVQNGDGESGVPAGQIDYRTTPGGLVNFREADLDAACGVATGEAMESVRFWSAALNTGRFLYDGQEDAMADRAEYFLKGSGNDRRLLRKLSYRAPVTEGTYYIEYMGRSVKGKMFFGRVAVKVEGSIPATSSTVSYQGSSLPVPFRTMDFQLACMGETQEKLASITFSSLPDRSIGVLYLDEKKPLDKLETYPAEEGMLDRLSFVSRAGYQGTVRIPYEGVSQGGRRFYGDVQIHIADKNCQATFLDMGRGWSWARPSVEYLKQKGIVNGRQDGAYDPASSVSRGEFVVMVCRTFGFTASTSSSFTDVSPKKFYAPAIAAAQERGILPDTGKRFYPDKPITRQDAAAILYGALKSEGQISTYADSSILLKFSDGGSVGGYAKTAMASLVQEGIFKGNDKNALRPKSPISRAEIAVILHRALTL